MASKNKIVVTIDVDDKGSLRVVAQEADKAAKGLDKTAKSAKKASKATQGQKQATDKVTSSTSRANDVFDKWDRRNKGAAQASANSTKNFSKMAQGITGGIVPAYATLAANIFALTAAFNFLRRAADVQLLEQTQLSFAASTGTAMQSVTQRLKEASKGMLGFREASEAAAIGLAKGFSPSQLENLAAGAVKASAALGRGFQDAFDRLLRGASKAEPELLDELGITLRLKDATERYAAALGTSAEALTTVQRSQAVLLETQRQLDAMFGDIEVESNPFVRLSKTFEELVKIGTQAVLPFFEGITEIINRSALSAIVIFGSLGLSIFKSMLPLDQMEEKMRVWKFSTLRGVVEAKKAWASYKQEIEATNKAIASSKTTTQSLAKNILKTRAPDAGESKILSAVAGGADPKKYGSSIGLRSALTAAKKNVNEFGVVTKGIFKGVQIEIVKTFVESFKQVEQVSMSTTQRMGAHWKNFTLYIKGSAQKAKAAWVSALAAIGKAALKTGAALSKMLRLVSVVGIITLVYELLLSLVSNIADFYSFIAKYLDAAASGFMKFVNTVARGVLGVIDTVINGILSVGRTLREAIVDAISWVLNKTDSFFNSIVDGFNFLLTKLGKEPIELKFTTQDNFTDSLLDQTEQMESTLAQDFTPFTENITAFSDGPINDFLEGIQESTRAWIEQRKVLAGFKSTFKAMKSDLDATLVGMAKLDDEGQKGIVRARALATLDISGQLDKINLSNLSEGAKKAAINELVENMKRLGELSPRFAQALQSLDYATIAEIQRNAADADASFKSLNDQISTVAQDISGGNLRNAASLLDQMVQTTEEGVKAYTDLGEAKSAEKMQKAYDRALGESVKSVEEFRKQIKRAVEVSDAINVLRAKEAFFEGETAAKAQATNELLQKRSELETTRLQILAEVNKVAREEMIAKRKVLEVEERRAAAQIKLANLDYEKKKIENLKEINRLEDTLLKTETKLSNILTGRGGDLTQTQQRELAVKAAERSLEITKMEAAIDNQRLEVTLEAALQELHISLERLSVEIEIAKLKKGGSIDTAAAFFSAQKASAIELEKSFKTQIDRQKQLNALKVQAAEQDLQAARLGNIGTSFAAEMGVNFADQVISGVEEAFSIAKNLSDAFAFQNKSPLENRAKELEKKIAESSSPIAIAAFSTELSKIQEQLSLLESQPLTWAQRIAVGLQSAFAAAKPFIEELKKMGPDGEVAAAVAQGAFVIADSWNAFAETLREISEDNVLSGKEIAQGLAGGLQAAANTMGAITQMMAAQSDARIARIEKEIEAEKKRDGKSAQSKAKIAALEKKAEQQKRKAFEKDKKMKMATAVLNTAAGIARAFAEHAFPYSVIIAGIVAAMGALQIATISSTSYDGGGASTPSTPSKITVGERQNSVDLATARSPAGELAYMRGESGYGSGASNYIPAGGAFTGHRAMGGNTSFLVGEQGPELFVPDRPGTIVPADDTAKVAPSSNITFNINAIDTQGMQEALEKQRGNMIRMFREAANANGEYFLEGVNIYD